MNAKLAVSRYPDALHIDASGPINGPNLIESPNKSPGDFFSQHNSRTPETVTSAVRPTEDSDVSDLSDSEPEPDVQRAEIEFKSPVAAEPEQKETKEKTAVVGPKIELEMVEKPVEKKPMIAKDKFIGEPTVTTEMTKNTYKSVMSTKKASLNKKGVNKVC